ncbi:hypothetical protein DQ384_39195 [Sphaerisporangium album]|uniref:Uncharacterized protein n=1 Tax=Sphaerisporangium album TaxID=509200 RepID=A0A367EJT4_9ACTN|nr:hypothetical protein [Sphaerisporangium album]RCG18223.1 hypothetical protein DQ384_39195 [Sphaerisporangium album]
MDPTPLPDNLKRRGYDQEHRNTVKNLRHALDDARKKITGMLDQLDSDPAGGLYGGQARQLATITGEIATYAGELDTANRLTFLLPPAAPENP